MARTVGAYGRQTDPGDDDGDRYGRAGSGASGTDVPDQTRQKTPLGVPEGYEAEVSWQDSSPSYYPHGYNYNTRQWGNEDLMPGARSPSTVPPRYFDGDQYLPRNLSPAEIWNIQQELASRGLLTTRFVKGTWDQPTANAYADILSYANQQGITDDQAMAQFLGSEGYRVGPNGELISLGSGEGEVQDPLPIRQTDPEQVKSIIRRSAIELLGVGLNREEVDSMAASYAEMEAQRQRQMYEAQQTPGETTYMDIPSPSDYAASQLEDTPEAQVYEGANYAAEAMKLLASPAWGIGGSG